jgi:glutaredoxin
VRIEGQGTPAKLVQRDDCTAVIEPEGREQVGEAQHPPYLSRWKREALILALLLALAAALAHAQQLTLEMWSRDGCPYCAEASAYLEELRQRRPDVRIVVYDVVRDTDARERFLALSEQNDVQRPGVPSFLVGGEFLVGWGGAEITGRALESLLSGAPALPAEPQRIRTRMFGEIDARTLGLPLFTAALGLLDGFNPCALWVLVFVLSLLVNIKDRGKVLLVGGTFVLASGVVYFAFMAAWLNVFLAVGVSRPIQVGLGAVATLIGLVNLKDFFAFGQGISFSIPDSAKPGIYARMRAVLLAESIAGALGAVIVLALLVNTVELLCTSGLPAVYTQILVARELPVWHYYGYLALYNVFYMLDDSVLLAAAAVTLRMSKLQERGGRVLKLVSGVVMLLLGLALVLRPEWLDWGAL